MGNKMKWVKNVNGVYSNTCNKCCAEQITMNGEFFEQNCTKCSWRCINFSENDLDCCNCKHNNILSDDSEI